VDEWQEFFESRRIINEPELEGLLSEFVFEKGFTWKKCPFLSRWLCFMVLSAWSRLTNLVFASAGTKVFELFEPEFVNPCYAILSAKLGLDYHILFNTSSQSPTPPFHWKNIPETVEVDCGVIKNALSKEFDIF
jgi:hypothetical protein